MKLALLLLLVAAGALVATMLARRSGGRRQRAVARLLDAADALETRLRTARAELEAVTDANPTREAMQEMLRHRLWLQQHGAGAPLEQLDRVRQSLDDARGRIERQLRRIQRARAPLA